MSYLHRLVVRGRRRNFVAAAALALALFATTTPAAADGPNLIGESGWQGYYPGDLSMSAVDRQGDPRSGSLLLAANRIAGAKSRCLRITGGTTYAAGGWIWIDPLLHRAGDYAVLGANYYADTHCDLSQPVSSSAAWWGVATSAGQWQPISRLVEAPAAARSVSIYAFVTQGEEATHRAVRAHFDDFFYRRASCAPGPQWLCLANGRFRVSATWKTRAGEAGTGRAVPFSGEAGSFSFFHPSNLELDVKLLDGCALNGSYWFFAAGMTDVEVKLTVTDTVTGAVKTYDNPLGRTFRTVTDTAAFAGCS